MEGSDTALSLNNLAGLYFAQERYSEAEPLYIRALAIWEKTLGPEHPNTATVYENLAILLGELSRGNEARAYEERAIQSRAAHSDAQHGIDG